MQTRIKTRYITLLLSLLTLAIMIVQLTSCGKKSDPAPAVSAQDQVKAQLIANPWKLQSVSVDGVDQTSVYTGFGITFTGSGYTTSKGGSVWPASGTWTFANTDGTDIKRDDGLDVQILVTATSLKMTLTWTKTTLGGGRIESLKGQNVFTMTK